MNNALAKENDETDYWIKRICPFTYNKNRFVFNNRNICNTIIPVPKIQLGDNTYVVTLGIIFLEKELLAFERTRCSKCDEGNLIIELPSKDTMKSFCPRCGKIVYEPVNKSIDEFIPLLELMGRGDKYYKKMLSFEEVVELIANVS